MTILASDKTLSQGWLTEERPVSYCFLSSPPTDAPLNAEPIVGFDSIKQTSASFVTWVRSECHKVRSLTKATQIVTELGLKPKYKCSATLGSVFPC